MHISLIHPSAHEGRVGALFATEQDGAQSRQSTAVAAVLDSGTVGVSVNLIGATEHIVRMSIKWCYRAHCSHVYFTCARVAREQKTCGRCFVFFIFGTLGCKSCVSVECLRFVSNTRLLRRSSECANFSKTKPRSALFRTQKLCAHTHTRTHTYTRT